MISERQSRWDLSWSRQNVAALGILCLLAAAALSTAAWGQSTTDSGELPVYPQRVELATQKIDPNIASAVSLRRLSGIGPKMAKRIIDYRNSHYLQPFTSAEDLAKVRGIGPKTVAKLAPHIEISPGR